MADTRDATSLPQFVGNRPKYPYGQGSIGIMNFLVDMSVVPGQLGHVIDGSNGDIIQLWDIPPLTHILSVALWLYKPEGAAATVVVSPGAFNAAFSLNGAVDTHTMTLVSDANGQLFGYSFASTDTLDLTFATDSVISVAVFGVSAACIFYEFPDLATTSPSTWH